MVQYLKYKYLVCMRNLQGDRLIVNTGSDLCWQECSYCSSTHLRQCLQNINNLCNFHWYFLTLLEVILHEPIVPATCNGLVCQSYFAIECLVRQPHVLLSVGQK